MNIKAKGAFKWSSAAACSSALRRYEEDGYGVLAVSDWKVAGAYAFLDTTLEIDADMASWRASFEQVAASAQEGEIDLDAGQGGFARVAREKGQKKPAVSELKAGFGEPHAARLAAWGDAIKKIEKAEAAALKKCEAERAAAEALSSKLRRASFDLGSPGSPALVASAGGVLTLAGGCLRRVDAAGESMTQEVRSGLGDYLEFAALDPETTVVWSTCEPRGEILHKGTRSSLSIERSAGADCPPFTALIDAFAGQPGEVILHETNSLRRLDVATGRELGRVALPEIQRRSRRREPRFSSGRNAVGVAFAEGIAFARNGDASCEIVAFDRGLRELFRVEVAHRVSSLLSHGGELLALAVVDYSQSSIAPVTREGLGEPLVECRVEGSEAVPVGDGAWVICGGFESAFVFEGLAPRPASHGWVARVVDVGPGGLVAVASVGYPGGIDLLVEGKLVRRILTPSGVSMQGACLVGEDVVWWSYGSSLFVSRAGSQTSERLVGHQGSIERALGLGGSRFASLDERGGLIFWDLAAG